MPALETGAAEALARGAAFLGFAKLLAPDVDELAGGATLANLIEVLGGLGAADARETLDRLEVAAFDDREQLSIANTRIFIRNIVAPYETSYMSANLVGHTRELADIAAFYRAFGFEVRGERPDHLLPEIEFASFLGFREAEAVDAADAEAAEITSDAFKTYLRDHLGCWVDTFAEKIGESETEAANPYRGIVESLGQFIAHVCDERGVEPRRPVEYNILAGIPVDSDDQPLACYGCPADEQADDDFDIETRLDKD